MRRLYTLLFYCLLPYAFIRLLTTSKTNKNHRYRLLERLALCHYKNTKPSIWIHAVSVGECIASTPLIKELIKQNPNHQIIITNTTPSGKQYIEKTFGDSALSYFIPYDVPACINRFLKKNHVQLLLIIEIELWPNLLYCCKKNKIPAVLANGRLSKQSMNNYKKIKRTAQNMMQSFQLIFAQYELDAEHYQALGATKDQIIITGNIKFDISPPENVKEYAQALRGNLHSKDRPIITIASTHHDEEQQWIPIIQQIKQQIPEALFIIVPRHLERFNKVYHLLTHHFSVARHSIHDPVTPNTDIYLGDTLGEMMTFYAVADIAFVGGSLVPTGGHNLLEPALFSLPILTGKHLHNFKKIKELLEDAEALYVSSDPQALANKVIALINNPAERKIMGAQAKKVVDSNKGALDEHLKHLNYILSSIRD